MERNISLDDENLLNGVSAYTDFLVIAVDPGVTTGISAMTAAYNNESKIYDVVDWGSTQLGYGGSGNLQDNVDSSYPEEFIAMKICDMVRAAVSSDLNVILVIEDFIVRKMNQSRDFLSPVRITSAIKAMLYADEKLKPAQVVMQTPADAKRVCTDERMDKWGFLIKTQKDRHSRDADRHAMLFIRKCSENQGRNLSNLYLQAQTS